MIGPDKGICWVDHYFFLVRSATTMECKALFFGVFRVGKEGLGSSWRPVGTIGACPGTYQCQC